MLVGFLLFFIIKIIVTCNGHLLWDPHNIDYDRLKPAADAAIVLESKKQYDSSFNVIKMDEHEQNSSRVLFAHLNPRPWLPLWTPCETEKVFPTAWNIQTNPNGPKLTPLQPNNLKFRWNLATVFKANKSKMARKGTTNQRVQNLRTHSYNPLCFFSALPCSYQRKDVYYVPRKDQI